MQDRPRFLQSLLQGSANPNFNFYRFDPGEVPCLSRQELLEFQTQKDRKQAIVAEYAKVRRNREVAALAQKQNVTRRSLQNRLLKLQPELIAGLRGW